MATLTELVATLTPTFEQVDKSLHVGLLITVLATFFVVPIYSLGVGGGPIEHFTILDDGSNIAYRQTAPPALIPLYYTFLGFVLLALLIQIYNAFYYTSGETPYIRTNWAMFVAALLAAAAADQVAIHVQRNTITDGLTQEAHHGGLSYIALAVPALSFCVVGYRVSVYN